MSTGFDVNKGLEEFKLPFLLHTRAQPNLINHLIELNFSERKNNYILWLPLCKQMPWRNQISWFTSHARVFKNQIKKYHGYVFFRWKKCLGTLHAHNISWWTMWYNNHGLEEIFCINKIHFHEFCPILTA